jgi:diguanylate cyclase (GGDEF)-like protein
MKLFILQRDEEVIAQQTLIAENAAQDTLLKERLKLQEKTRQELESQVDERTFELQVTLRELEEKNRSLELLNTENALTGIKNRRFFDKKLIMEIRRSRREQTPLSIVMLDIDRFKSINDTYGHIIGDQVIKAVSDLIKDHLKRPLDEVARYGGEEFVVLLPNTPSEGAQDIAEKIRAAISASTVTVANNDIQFTISAGVYTSIADDVSNPQIFTECADKALYYAKQHGRNQVITFPLPQ